MYAQVAALQVQHQTELEALGNMVRGTQLLEMSGR